MDLDYSLPNLLLLLGALQGVIFSIILLARKKHQAHIFLSIFMLTLSYNAFESFAAVSGLASRIAFFDLFAFTAIFLLGPSFYCYIRTILFPEQRIPSKHLVKHFSPFLFQLAANLFLLASYLLVSYRVVSLNWEFAQLYGFLDLYGEPLSIVVFSYYLLLSFRLLKRVQAESVKLIYPKTVKALVMEWSKILLITLSVFAVLWLVTYTLPFLTENNPLRGYFFIEIFLMFFIYWISFAAHHRLQQVHDHLGNVKQNIVFQSEANLKMEQLQQVMLENKPYLNPKVTREVLAKEIGLGPKELSAILNQHYGQSFNDFINQYRIDEVKASLSSNTVSQKTISGIALDAGFNSQATFQRAFKKIIGMSPKAYLSELKKD